ncbi:MAG: hypothetical protein APF80_13090 [Alphaproteobacteria bacterium BRH_c36]|nr:MAG: hypothetical protein APF80_13090 [Alphaproteobacteria bacterium BRH_c36]
MKQFMIDMMATMMPFMRPATLIAGVALVFGLIAASVSRLTGSGSGSTMAKWCGVLALAVGVFLLACEVAGRMLGFEPTILFASPADRVLYQNQWPFWTIGLGLVIAAIAVRHIAKA